jgi:hypothetical protein
MFYTSLTAAAFMIFSRDQEARVSRMLRSMNAVVLYPIIHGQEINPIRTPYLKLFFFWFKNVKIAGVSRIAVYLRIFKILIISLKAALSATSMSENGNIDMFSVGRNFFCVC